MSQLAHGINNARRPVSKVVLMTPPGKITVTSHGSRERKLAVPPLGIAYLAAVLEQNGICVEVIDVLAEGYENETVNGSVVLYGLGEEDIRRRLQAFQPDMIGVSCLFSNRGKEALDLCRIAKDECPDATVVLGGQHPSGMPSMVLNAFVDCILYGETEVAIIELINAINNRTPLEDVSQIILKKDDGYWKSPKKSFPDVHTLPYPAWDRLPLDKYWEAGLSHYEISKEKKKFMVMITSRGCPHNCYFCTAPMMTDRLYRQRKIEDVIREIRFYQEKYGIEEIQFWDDNFFINKKRVKELLRTLVRELPGMTFQVPSGSEINAIDEEVIDLMAQAGFTKLFMAVESPNEDMQEQHVDKRVNLARITELVEKLRAAGIVSEGSFMIGFPGETKEQIDRTFRRATEFGFDRISISIVNPLPGTDLYDEVERAGLLRPGFDPQDIRYSAENIIMPETGIGYIGKRRREVWQAYMESRIDINEYERQNVVSELEAESEEYQSQSQDDKVENECK